MHKSLNRVIYKWHTRNPTFWKSWLSYYCLGVHRHNILTEYKNCNEREVWVQSKILCCLPHLLSPWSLAPTPHPPPRWNKSSQQWNLVLLLKKNKNLDDYVTVPPGATCQNKSFNMEWKKNNQPNKRNQPILWHEAYHNMLFQPLYSTTAVFSFFFHCNLHWDQV